MKAVWKDTVLADSEHTIVIEGNHYFPPESVKRAFFLSSNHKTMCSIKGQASYLSLFVDGDVNPDAAWFYPAPLDAAKDIKDHVAFFKGVRVID